MNVLRSLSLMRALRCAIVASVALATTSSMLAHGQSAREYPPSLPPAFGDIPLAGGRVHSIAVNPTNRDHIVAAHQIGGLWKTVDGGSKWFHLGALRAVFASDIAYAPDGRTLIATVRRDLAVDNGGGIWVSRNGGASWSRPVTGVVPATVAGLRRTSAYGISYAPDDARTVYVGTDYGVATSTDNGETSNHRLLDPTGPAAYSVQGLTANRALAVTTDAIYLKDGSTDAWTVARTGSFSMGFKNTDLLPDDNDKALVLQDYRNLLLYELRENRWTVIRLPAGSARGPFVRAARGSAGPPAVDLWVGAGVLLRKASCLNIDCIRRLSERDWRALHRAEGLHDDSGHLGVDAQKRPVMYGSDGGLFKPQNEDGTAWTRAAPPGTGMNSYQITSLSGTNFNHVAQPLPSLYFATQDNAIWASSDGGRTWPQNDCAEGWHMQTWHQASTLKDPAARLAYGRTGCGTPVRYSDPNLLNQRDVLNIDRTGRRFRGNSYSAFLLSPGNWIRFVDSRRTDISGPAGSFGIYVSTDNLERWQLIRTTLLNPSGAVFRSSGPLASPTTYTAFEGARPVAGGPPRVALARIDDVPRGTLGTVVEADLRYLPPDGSLGVRATEFDWHAVYGVDPRNPDFVIAPDIVNRVVWFSTRGGLTWARDDELTERVTQGGRLMMYEGSPGQVQVTHIAFSPYERNLILVGTREAGVIYSDDYGTSWHTIPGSGAMLFVTGFFFTPGRTVYASTYGRGLWQLDIGRRDRRPFPVIPICGFNYQDCIVRLPPDPQQNVVQTFPWDSHNVLVVFGGRINGVIRSGDHAKSVTVTPGATYRFYAVNDEPMPEISESAGGAGFATDPAAEFALKNQEVITGVILKTSQPVGFLTNRSELKAEHEVLSPKQRAEVEGDKPATDAPYLSISTGSPLGPGVVQAGGLIRLFATGFVPGASAEVRLDGKMVAEKKVGKGGLEHSIKVTEELPEGQHLLEVVQKTQQGERKAAATFVKVVKVRDDDRLAAR